MNDPAHIVCPHCWAVNRVPMARLENAPLCGKCKQQLFDGHAVELSAGNFERFIERNDIPVLIDFWAPWCGPCQMMAPAFQEAALAIEPRMRLAKVNIDAAPAIASRFAIQSIPTLCVFQNGKELGRKNGALNLAGILQWVAGIHTAA